MKRFDPILLKGQLPLGTMGERIKAVRLTWRWSQEETAKALKVDQASISFWERDRITPSGSAMVALAAIFRTTVKALETGDGFVIPEPPAAVDPSNEIKEFPRCVGLPTYSGENAAAMVDLADGSSKSTPISEAMVALVQGVKDGRRVWLVLE